MIIGLTGTFASGKDTVADYFKKRGFSYYSCSDIIRDVLHEMGKESNRENLINMGNELRKKNGNAYLAQETLKKIQQNQDKNALVVSIRHPEEVQALKKDSSFNLILVDAPLEVRFQRSQNRQGRPEDKDTFEEFKNHEERERKGSGSGQQLDQVATMADYTLLNDGTLEELYKKTEEIIRRING